MAEGKEINYYEVLHVHPDAPVEIIRASYRTLMTKLQMHPDRGGDTAMAALINRAYAVLSDAARRREYDEDLRRRATAQPARPATASDKVRASGAASTGRAASQPTKKMDYAAVLKEYCIFCMAPHNYGSSAPLGSRCAECRSPLVHSLRSDAVKSGRRDTLRFSANQVLVFLTEWPATRSHHGVINDLSLNGIQFSGARQLTPTQIVKISSATIEAVARIRYCRRDPQGGFLAGGEFITVDLHKDRGAFVSVKT